MQTTASTMRTAITGASGLLGANLADVLLRGGSHVRATRRSSTKVDHLQGLAIEWVNGDLDDVERLTEAFRGTDVVFHCAAQVGVSRKTTPKLHHANVDGTRNVLEAFRASGAKRLVHCSTTAAVGLSTDGSPCTEESPLNFAERGMDEGYGRTKHEAEELVREAARAGMDAVIASPCFMIGPLDAKPSSGRLVVDVVSRKIPSLIPGRNNFVDVRDVARGMVLVAQRGRAGERYILGGENLTYGEMCQRVARVAGVAPPTLRVPRWVVAPLGWVGDVREAMGAEPLVTSTTLAYGYCPDFVFSSDKARRELGYTTSPLDDAIRDAIAWFKAKGMLA